MDKDISTSVQENINKYYPILAEVRRRLLFILSIFLLFGILGFWYYQQIISFIISLIDLKGVNIVFTDQFQYINLAISCFLSVGLIISIPLVIYQLMTFLRPALKSKEYRSLVTFLPLSILLFIGGFAFGFMMMKWVIVIFYTTSTQLNIGNMLDISKLLNQVLVTSALMGLAFQFPIVMSLLMDFNVVSHKLFSAGRPVAYMIAIIFAALMPPTDILSLTLLTLPLVILFELTLLLNKFFRKGVI